MNSDTFKGKWKQLKGKVKSQWGKLTDDDVEQIDGKKDRLIGRLQERYGKARDEMHEAVNRWLDREQNDAEDHEKRKAS